MDVLSQNLHETHTNLAKCRCGPHVAAELRGDGPAVEHLATGTEAVNRRMATRPSDVMCSPGPGEQYLSAKHLAIMAAGGMAAGTLWLRVGRRDMCTVSRNNSLSLS